MVPCHVMIFVTASDFVLRCFKFQAKFGLLILDSLLDMLSMLHAFNSFTRPSVHGGRPDSAAGSKALVRAAASLGTGLLSENYRV